MDGITSGVTVDDGPQIRLLVCLDCKTIEELPDFNGPPEYDTLLEIATERHRSGALNIPHSGHLMKVPLKHWSVPTTRKEIIRQIREGSRGLDDLDAGFYDAKSTFQEDALKCYQQHLRPKGQCPDYMSDKKVLRPKTDELRKEAGLPSTKKAGPVTYLCQFCPVHVYNVTKKREIKGLYK